MRLIFLLGLIFLIDLYAFQAFRGVTLQWSAWSRNLLLICYGLLSLLVYIYFIGAPNRWFEGFSKEFTLFVRAFALIITLCKIPIALFLGIDDFRRLVLYAVNQMGLKSETDLSRSRFLTNVGVFMGAAPFFSLIYGMVRNPYRYKVHKLKVPVRGLPKNLEGLKIVQISDIHAGSFIFKDPIKNGIDLINAQNPDLVFFTGDMVNTASDEMLPYLDVFKNIRAKYGVYSVLGNHDYGDYQSWPSSDAKIENLDSLKEMHRQMGWKLLLDENDIVTVNDEPLAVIGVENCSALPRFHTYGDLRKAYKGAEDVPTKILLSHDPSHWDQVVRKEYKDIALTLSGHTHGFQFGVEIPGVLKWSPSQYVFKQWAGLYSEGDQHLYVNRGFGVLGYPGRVGILPEITLIELLQSEES